MPNSNDLQKLVEIWKETTTTNSVGTPTESYLLYKKTYARILFKSGTSINTENKGVLPTAYTEILVRYDSEIDYKCKVKYNNWWYLIGYIEEVDRKAFMRLDCTVYEDVNEDE
jgi:head-tail adaptor